VAADSPADRMKHRLACRGGFERAVSVLDRSSRQS